MTPFLKRKHLERYAAPGWAGLPPPSHRPGPV